MFDDAHGIGVPEKREEEQTGISGLKRMLISSWALTANPSLDRWIHLGFRCHTLHKTYGKIFMFSASPRGIGSAVSAALDISTMTRASRKALVHTHKMLKALRPRIPNRAE